MKVKFRLAHPNAKLPSYAKEGDAGLDLTATELIKATPETLTYSFGLAVEIPEGYVGLIFPRSSIRKKALALTNCVGVIDSGYRGILQATFRKLKLDDDSEDDYQPGDRIAQMIIMPFPQIEVERTDELKTSERGASGFGSSGA